MTMTRRNALHLGAATLTTIGVVPAAAMRSLAQETAMLEADTVTAAQGDIAIHPVSHASLVLGADDTIIYVDPVGGAELYAGLPDPDLILITHEHGDHFDLPTLQALAGDDTRLVTNPAVYDMLPAELQGKAAQLANGEGGTAAGVAIDAIPAYNTTEDRLNYHPQGRDNGYILSLAGGRVYIAGDTEDIPEMRALTGIDLAFLPMNLPYTMSVEQAADAVLAFAPKVVYPYHYRGSEVDAFKSQVDAAGAGIEVRLAEWY